MKIDVIVLTKNSERLLEECLNSIFDNVPVNRLIVVDNYSTDKTLQIIKNYCNVVLLQDRGTRGKARQLGIENVETEWFMFVDSDVILCQEWFRKAFRFIQDNVGAIFGIDMIGNIKNGFLKKLLQIMSSRAFEIRGGCHDILIRHDAVKNIKIPEQLHTLEDAYIKEEISKNYEIIITYSPYCRHYKTVSNLVTKENVRSTILEFRDFKQVKERLVYSSIFALVWFLQQKRGRQRI